jgi:hypothetical protein
MHPARSHSGWNPNLQEELAMPVTLANKKPNAEQIKSYCYTKYIRPAHRRGEFSITLRAGSVRNAMKEDNLGKPELPAVCSALGSNEFESTYGLKRIHVEGPLNGANTYLTFLLLDNLRKTRTSPEQVDSGRKSWTQASLDGLARAYGEEEPEYSLEDIKP